MWWFALVDLALNTILIYVIFSTPLPSTLCICFAILACWTISFCKLTANLVATTNFFLTLKFREKLWSLSLYTSSDLSLWIIDIFPLYGGTPHMSNGKSILYYLYEIGTNVLAPQLLGRTDITTCFPVNINCQDAGSQITDISRVVPVLVISKHTSVAFT